MYDIKGYVMAGIIAALLSSIITFIATSEAKNARIKKLLVEVKALDLENEKLNDEAKEQHGTWKAQRQRIDDLVQINRELNTRRDNPVLEVMTADPTTGGLGTRFESENLQTAFMFIKENLRHWDVTVTLKYQRRATVVLFLKHQAA